MLLLEIKIFLTGTSDDRSYCFVAGVTFKFSNNISVPLFMVNIRGNEHVTNFKTSLLTVNSRVNPSTIFARV